MDEGVAFGTLHAAPVPRFCESPGHAFSTGAGKVPSTLRVTAALVRPSHTLFQQPASANSVAPAPPKLELPTASLSSA